MIEKWAQEKETKGEEALAQIKLIYALGMRIRPQYKHTKEKWNVHGKKEAYFITSLSSGKQNNITLIYINYLLLKNKKGAFNARAIFSKCIFFYFERRKRAILDRWSIISENLLNFKHGKDIQYHWELNFG